MLYAAAPGAFVDLAADMSYALGLAPALLPLDDDTAAPVQSSGITGLHAQAIVNQALGVLIGRGHTPETADEELKRLAARDGGNLHTAAEAITRSTTRGDGPIASEPDPGGQDARD